MIIRKASVKDVSEIVKLHKETVLKENSRFYSSSQIKSWVENITHKNVEKDMEKDFFLVAEEDNQILGFSHFDKEGVIFEIYVRNDLLGQGIGSKLLGESEKILYQLGVKKIKLNSTLNAFKFYKKHGFRLIKEILFGEKKIKMILMEKNLNEINC